MAIGRTFHESLQKALRSMETGLTVSTRSRSRATPDARGAPPRRDRRAEAPAPRPHPRHRPGDARGLSSTRSSAATGYDRGSSSASARSSRPRRAVAPTACPRTPRPARLKEMGFSDARLGALTNSTRTAVRRSRHAIGVTPCSSGSTPAPRSSRRRPPTCIRPTRPTGARRSARPPLRSEKVVILGGGPNRIGQGIEFDYCCCHACFALTEAGFETIMVNCNPETVSPTTTPPTGSISSR